MTLYRHSKPSEPISQRLAWLLFPALAILVWTSSGSAQVVCGSAGKDGPSTISGAINTYFPGVVGATVSAGSTSIPVGSANINGSSTPIAPGDLLLIIQMQDASLTVSNNSNYGGGTGTGSGYTGGTAGIYEFVVAQNSVPVSGGTIVTTAGVVNSYITAAATGGQGKRTYQVVRVPQYASASISGTVLAARWDGASGGMIVIDVAGTLTLGGGTLNASGRGFRGGGGRTLTGTTGTNTDYRFAATNWGASKGEGIAGTPRYVYDSAFGSVTDTGVEGYPSGSFGRGGPGNAGGGGNDGDPATNDENSGGGGGGNGGAGGLGGNSWQSNLPLGGHGGAAFTQAGINRLVMGGGGGAGTSNNGAQETSSGAAGGGIVIVRAGALAGSATINVNGANAPNAAPTCCDDGAGGGGGGGTILVVAKNTAGVSGLTAAARGGSGGDTLGTGSSAHGPGGGGGGGVVLSNAALGGISPVAGGVNGTTNGGVSYSSTPGSTGLVDASLNMLSIPGIHAGTSCLPVLTVTKVTSTPTATTGGTASYSISVSNAASTSPATGVTISDNTLPAGFTYSSTSNVTLNGGATRPTTTNPSGTPNNPGWSDFTIPASASVVITFLASINNTVPSGTYQNPATAIYLDPTRTTVNGTTSASYNPASSTGEDVTINPPNVALVKAIVPVGSQPPDTDLTYSIQFTNSGGTAAQSLVIIDAIPDNTDFKIGSMSESLGSSGLTLVREYSNDYNPASPGTATWSYTPTSGGGGAASGYDRLVKAIRWRVTAGVLGVTAPNNTAQVSFTSKIR